MRAIAIYTSEITGKTVRAYKNNDTGEFVIKLIGAPKADYFTDDKDDAIATMKAMADFVPVRKDDVDYLVTIDCGDGTRTVYARTDSLVRANLLASKWRAPAIERITAATVERDIRRLEDARERAEDDMIDASAERYYDAC